MAITGTPIAGISATIATPSATNLITQAYAMIGNRNALTADLDEGLNALNDLLDSWSNMRRLISVNIIESFSLVATQREYTIGNEGTEDFGTVRPIKIISAFIRQLSTNTDFPITVYTKDEYNRIVDKTVTGQAWKMVYLNEFPSGKIILNRTPTQADTLHIDTWKPFTDAANLNTTFSFPAGYRNAFRLNIAVQLADNTTQKISQWIRKRAEDAKKMIRAVNSTPIPKARFDRRLVRMKGRTGTFDVRSGRFF